VADVFISYSNPIPRPTWPWSAALSVYLESKGWTVWWDRNLAAGDEFRDEIMKELGRSRAVIVIWTKNSTTFHWVRSEAGRAQADAKLITVKTPEIDYEQIPPPFDVLHAEDIANKEQIQAPRPPSCPRFRRRLRSGRRPATRCFHGLAYSQPRSLCLTRPRSSQLVPVVPLRDPILDQGPD
jgi:hypothetical protein